MTNFKEKLGSRIRVKGKELKLGWVREAKKVKGQ